MTREELACRIAKDEVGRLTSSRSGSDREIAVRIAVTVVKQAGLRPETHGDVALLCRVLGCSADYARKVLHAVAVGQEESLLRRETRRDAIVATYWPRQLQEFISRPEYSRTLPGKESVSVGYGKRVEKKLLLMAKPKLVGEFRQAFPQCPYSSRVLMREIPRNCVTAGPQDFGRNVCVMHTNFRHVVSVLQKAGLLQDCPASCRYIASLPLCKSGADFSQMAALTWGEACATGRCLQCPGYTLTCPLPAPMVALPQWKTKLCEIKGKQIYSLFTETMSLQEVVALFNKQLPRLSSHIYTAARQWEAYQADLATLKPGHMGIVVDFQMNLNILHYDSTTTSHMGAHTSAAACYPSYINVGLADGTVAKGGIIFLSRDLKHDRHQVKMFEERILDFVREKYGVEVTVISRWSDQCAQQFKSQYCVHDQVTTNPEKTVHWNFFEVGEGKNMSDMLGSLAKLAYIRAVATCSTEGATVHTIPELIQLIRPHLAETTKKFDFLELVELEPFDRPDKASDLGIVVTNLQKQHHFSRSTTSQLNVREISCKDCLKLKVCHKK